MTFGSLVFINAPAEDEGLWQEAHSLCRIAKASVLRAELTIWMLPSVADPAEFCMTALLDPIAEDFFPMISAHEVRAKEIGKPSKKARKAATFIVFPRSTIIEL